MQCDGDTMELLPALPEPWKDGEINGLKARGNYSVDLVWKDGKVKQAKVTSLLGGKLTVQYNSKKQVLTLKKGKSKILK